MQTKLSDVSETMLIPLWARAKETMYGNSIVIDNKAVEIMKKIDYDFSKFDKSWITQIGVAVRTKILDEEVTKFINLYENSIVINIGCGLDTRFERIDNGKVVWYDLDLPQSIELRKNFFSENERYKMISKSVFDSSWVENIKQKNKKILVISEGLFMYFSKEEVVNILDILQKGFEECECLVEVTSPFIAKHSGAHDTVNKTDARFKWGIGDGRDLELYNMHLNFIEEWNFFDYYQDRWGSLKLLSRIPCIKKNCNNRILHFNIQ